MRPSPEVQSSDHPTADSTTTRPSDKPQAFPPRTPQLPITFNAIVPSDRIRARIWADGRLLERVKLVCLLVAEHVRYDNLAHTASLKVKTICLWTSLSDRTVRRAVQAATGLGVWYVDRRRTHQDFVFRLDWIARWMPARQRGRRNSRSVNLADQDRSTWPITGEPYVPYVQNQVPRTPAVARTPVRGEDADLDHREEQQLLNLPGHPEPEPPTPEPPTPTTRRSTVPVDGRKSAGTKDQGPQLADPGGERERRRRDGLVAAIAARSRQVGQPFDETACREHLEAGTLTVEQLQTHADELAAAALPPAGQTRSARRRGRGGRYDRPDLSEDEEHVYRVSGGDPWAVARYRQEQAEVTSSTPAETVPPRPSRRPSSSGVGE